MSYALGPKKVQAVLYEDSPNMDAFKRLRVSDPTTLLDTTNQYDTSPLFWENVITGGATVAHLPNESAVRLRCGTANGDKVVRQSRTYLRYQPGKGQLIRRTFLFGVAVTGVRRRYGYFDPNNGLFLEQTGTGLRMVRRTFTSGSAVDNLIEQSAWNMDKLDGTGPSGLTLDITKAQHLVIDLEWLGVGGVRFGFEFGGGTNNWKHVVYVHEETSPNILTTVYMTTANLPLRAEIENTTGQGGDHDLIEICSTVISEGGFESERGYPFTAAMVTSKPGIGTTRTPLLSIRPAATFNAIINRGQILPESLEFVIGSGTGLVEVIYAPTTLTGASFAAVNASSITEFDTAATAIAGGLATLSAFGAGGAATARDVQSAPYLSRLPLTLDIAGTNPIALTVCARAFTGTIDAAAALSFRELR